MTNIQFLKNRFSKEFDNLYIKSRGNGIYEISNKYFDDGDVKLENTITVKILSKCSDFNKYNQYKAFLIYHHIFVGDI